MTELIKSSVMENIIMPIIVIIGSALIMIVRSYVVRIRDSIIARNNISVLNDVSSIKNNLLHEIETVVQAAVFTNMKLAAQLKFGGRKLSDSDASMLRESAKSLVYQSLPSTLTNNDGVMLQIIGGKEQLDSIIGTMLEKAVLDAKK